MRVISRSTEPKLVAIPEMLVAFLLNRLVRDFFPDSPPLAAYPTHSL